MRFFRKPKDNSAADSAQPSSPPGKKLVRPDSAQPSSPPGKKLVRQRATSITAIHSLPEGGLQVNIKHSDGKDEIAILPKNSVGATALASDCPTASTEVTAG